MHSDGMSVAAPDDDAGVNMISVGKAGTQLGCVGHSDSLSVSRRSQVRSGDGVLNYRAG
jgi:hypothetical protein